MFTMFDVIPRGCYPKGNSWVTDLSDGASEDCHEIYHSKNGLVGVYVMYLVNDEVVDHYFIDWRDNPEA